MCVLDDLLCFLLRFSLYGEETVNKKTSFRRQWCPHAVHTVQEKSDMLQEYVEKYRR